MTKIFKKILIVFSIFVLSFTNIGLFFNSISQVYATQLAQYQKSFIETIAPTAMQLGKQYKLFPSIMIAQAILESDWGRSSLSKAPYYNLFGIKSPNSEDGVVFDTQEDDGLGNLYWIKDSFRRYNSINESMVDYAKLFTSTPFLERHYASFLNASTVQEATIALTGTYATDTRYGTSLMSIIVAYNLLQYDSSIGKGPSWKLQETNDFVYVTHDEVNIRSTHSTEHPPLGRVHINTKLFRLGTLLGGWSKIKLNDGKIVYIATQYLSTSPVGTEIIKEPDIKINEIINDNSSLDENKDEDTVTSNILSPKEPLNDEEEIFSFTTEEVEKAKAIADAAIANQVNNPSTAPETGVLDVRTVNENKLNVNKVKLENLLGVNVNLPFVTDEIKKEFEKKIKEARYLYYKPDSTQEEIDKIVKILNDLRDKASDESVAGEKKDLKEVRNVDDKKYGISISYTKEALREEEVKLDVHLTRKPKLDETTLNSLTSIGEKYIEYKMKIKTNLSNDARLYDKINIYLPIPLDMNPENIAVYRFADDYTLHEVVFEVDSVKRLAIVSNKQTGRYIIIEKKTKNNLKYNLSNVVMADTFNNSKQYPITNLGRNFFLFLIFSFLLRLLYKFFMNKKRD